MTTTIPQQTLLSSQKQVARRDRHSRLSLKLPLSRTKARTLPLALLLLLGAAEADLRVSDIDAVSSRRARLMRRLRRLSRSESGKLGWTSRDAMDD